jgi:hypothetical protein
VRHLALSTRFRSLLVIRTPSSSESSAALATAAARSPVIRALPFLRRNSWDAQFLSADIPITASIPSGVGEFGYRNPRINDPVADAPPEDPHESALVCRSSGSSALLSGGNVEPSICSERGLYRYTAIESFQVCDLTERSTQTRRKRRAAELFVRPHWP